LSILLAILALLPFVISKRGIVQYPGFSQPVRQHVLGSFGQDHTILDNAAGEIFSRLAWIIHECRCEAFETEARRGFSQVRPTQAYSESVEEAEREKPRRARGSARRPKAPADGSDDVSGIHE
jgi:hypothetical protein